jgi:hypothetical protein
MEVDIAFSSGEMSDSLRVSVSIELVSADSASADTSAPVGTEDVPPPLPALSSRTGDSHVRTKESFEMPRRHSTIWIALLIAAGLASTFALSAPASGEEATNFYRWTALSAEEQLAADQTAVPGGQGAIFVPAMSKGIDEPEVLVYSGEERIASGKTGTRILVAPGTYAVRVGSGAIKQMTDHQATVKADATTTVAPSWAGLKVEVVDTQNIPHRGTYELIRSGEQQVFGLGQGADSLQGEALQTWLLPSGLYRIVRQGETYRARRDFATVFLPEGGLVHFKLVIEEETGDFRGGGIVTAQDIGIAPAEGSTSRWNHRSGLSAGLTMNDTKDFVGEANQSSYGGSIFLDTYSTYENGPHFFGGIFELEEGALKVDPATGPSLPTQQIQDRLRIDTLYTRFISDRWGPYVRFGLLTNVFPAETLATQPIDVAYNFIDGSRTVQSLAANEQYRTADGFGSLRLREGVGVNVRLLRNQTATVSWRGGVGLRQNEYSSSFVVDDDPATPELDLFELESFNQEGLETTLLATVRLSRLFTYITDLEVFGDFGELGDPTIDWRNTLSLRLTRYLSLDYRYDLLDFPQVSEKTQTRQILLLRVSLDLL